MLDLDHQLERRVLEVPQQSMADPSALVERV